MLGGEGLRFVGVEVVGIVLSMNWEPSVRTCVINVLRATLLVPSVVVVAPFVVVLADLFCAADRMGWNGISEGSKRRRRTRRPSCRASLALEIDMLAELYCRCRLMRRRVVM